MRGRLRGPEALEGWKLSMELGFSSFACPDWSLRAMAHWAKKIGYGALEVRCDAGHLHGVEVLATSRERASLKRELDRSNVRLACLGTGLQFAREDALEQMTARAVLAADLGAPGIRVHCGLLEEGVSLHRELPEIARRLHEAALISQQHGVQLWLETHDTVSRAADAVALLQAANHPALGIVYDNLHPLRQGEALQDTMRLLEGQIRLVHFHDGIPLPHEVQITRLGEGTLPVRDILTAILASNFQGCIVGEWFYEQYGRTPEQSLRLFHEDMHTLASICGVNFT